MYAYAAKATRWRVSGIAIQKSKTGEGFSCLACCIGSGAAIYALGLGRMTRMALEELS